MARAKSDCGKPKGQIHFVPNENEGGAARSALSQETISSQLCAIAHFSMITAVFTLFMNPVSKISMHPFVSVCACVCVSVCVYVLPICACA